MKLRPLGEIGSVVWGVRHFGGVKLKGVVEIEIGDWSVHGLGWVGGFFRISQIFGLINFPTHSTLCERAIQPNPTQPLHFWVGSSDCENELLETQRFKSTTTLKIERPKTHDANERERSNGWRLKMDDDWKGRWLEGKTIHDWRREDARKWNKIWIGKKNGWRLGGLKMKSRGC